MKKLLTIAVITVLALSLVACGGIKDGTYTAQASTESNGWTDTLSVTYKGGKVVDAKYDAINAEGTLKSELSDAEYDMPTPLSQWLPQLNANIVAAGSADKIEAVAGATSSYNNAKVLMAAVEGAAKKSDTNTVMVEMPKKS